MTHDTPIAAPALPAVAAAQKLSASVVPGRALGNDEAADMFALLAAHFEGVDRPTFDRDLAEKNWVVTLRDDDGCLRGFSTLLIYPTRASGRPVTVVYSGDTIVDPSAWGSPALPRAWIQAVHELSERDAAGELYWLLLTSGFRTYRFMSVFCRSFYPRFDGPTPPAAQRMIDELSAERFGAAYDRSSGLVRFARPQRLRDHLSAVPDGRTADPHVRFFLDRNPGHVRGDELVSLASLALENLTSAGRRMARRNDRCR
jgi:hypothetical protein